MKHRLVIAALIVMSVSAALFLPLPVAAAAPQARTVVVNSQAFGYAPAVVRVQRGDTVTLVLESSDAVHGLFVDGYEVDLKAEPGRRAQVTFVADKEGQFKFRCSVACGALHPFMIGELHVEPNWPLLRAGLATVVVALGGLVYFWKER